MSERGDILVLFSLGEGWMFYLLALWEKFYAGRSAGRSVNEWQHGLVCVFVVGKSSEAFSLYCCCCSTCVACSACRQTDRQTDSLLRSVVWSSH